MQKDKNGYKPTIPFWRSPKGKDSVMVTPELYDMIQNNLKIGQILYLNIYEPEENKPIAKVAFGPQLEELQKTRALAAKYKEEAEKPAEETTLDKSEGDDAGGFF